MSNHHAHDGRPLDIKAFGNAHGSRMDAFGRNGPLGPVVQVSTYF